MGLKELFESAEVIKFIYIDFPISIKRDLEQIKQNYIPEFSFENKGCLLFTK